MKRRSITKARKKFVGIRLQIVRVHQGLPAIAERLLITYSEEFAVGPIDKELRSIRTNPPNIKWDAVGHDSDAILDIHHLLIPCS